MLNPFRLTDLPQRKWLGFWLLLFKSFEVIIFKFLEVLELYRAQKSIIGIPGLGTRQFTMLQAVVYNGTQEEVLGFRPRRLLHRLLRGVPDLEAYERVKFSISFSETLLKTVEASTEVRGFIQLQIPWQLPWKCDRQAWLRMSPGGVETIFGRVRLGDYELISAPVFFITKDVKWVVVSDIDDTIKDSHIAQTTSFRKIVKGVFRGHYYTYDAISGMAELYQSLAEKGCLIIYLTSTPFALAPFLLKFLRTQGFPEGPVFLRWLGNGRVRHKWRTLHRILGTMDKERCVLVGDSGEKDLQIYRRIAENRAYGKRIDRILIRHVPGTKLEKASDKREMFFASMDELKLLFKPLLEGK